jgi:hypothetical protein
MLANSNILNSACATDLILEIPKYTQKQVWQESQDFSNAYSGYQAYLNKLCLITLLQWFQEDISSEAKPWRNTAILPSFWELVNGSVISLEDTQVVLVPSEAIDSSELRVPQEWVDIASWVGDYYLAVQVEPDEGFVRVWGYSTHKALKTEGSYDACDRTYSLDRSKLICDISVLCVARKLCPQEPTRETVTPLPTLTQQQARNLLCNLGKTEIITPRLEIPFLLWGALIAHGGWRQSLYQRRLGLPEQWLVPQWFFQGVSRIAGSVGWQSLNRDCDPGVSAVHKMQYARQLVIAGQSYELQITLERGEATICRFELYNAMLGKLIPCGFKLRLLTEDLQPLPNNEDIATTAVKSIFVTVTPEPGQGIVWETEPLPENYDREILKF